MTQASVISTRIFLWSTACDAVDLRPSPPFTAGGLAEQPAGELEFRAERPTLVNGEGERVTLTVAEHWQPGNDPLGDRRLESEGCWLALARWHLQASGAHGGRGSERLDVIPTPDDDHSRVHRHPYGQDNEVRQPAELTPPQVWLSALLVLIESAGARDHWDPATEE